MSGQFAIVPVSVLERKDLTPSDKLTFVALASYADRGHRCFPGAASLSRRTGLSARSIFRAVRDLEQAGVIAVERQFDPDRREYAVNRYSLQYDEIPQGSDNLSVGTDRMSVGHDTVSVGHDRKYPRVVSQCHNISTKKQYQEQYQEQSGENPEVSPSKGSLSKDFLEIGPPSESKTKERGGAYPDFDERIREHFKTLCETYPKKSGVSKICYALFRQFFSTNPADQEKNSDRLTNVLSAAAAYRDECKNREPKYIKSLQNWLREVDPDIPVMVETETLVRCSDETDGDAA